MRDPSKELIDGFNEQYENGEMDEEVYDEMKEFLIQANKAYYNTNTKIITDTLYDELREKWEGIMDEKLPVGAEPPKDKGIVESEHKFNLVGTLEKKNTLEEFEEWYDKINKKLSSAYPSIVVSEKFDGNSITIEFYGGEVVQALTRGRDQKGMDLTHVFKDHTINNNEHIGIRYEVIISYEDFDKINEENPDKNYANPRSLVAGKLGDDNAADFYEYFTLVPLGIESKERELTREEELDLMEEIYPDNYFSNSVTIIEGISLESKEEMLEVLEEMYNDYSKKRTNMDYMIDGLVIETLEDSYRNSLGWKNDDIPNYSIALKFPYLEKESVITGIRFDQNGNSNRVTPTLQFEPVEFNGATYQYQSISNYKRFQNMQPIGEGTKVIIQLRNEVLTYIQKMDDSVQPEVEPFEFIQHCPVCGEELYVNDNETFVFCDNPDCMNGKVGKIVNYLKYLDIKGFKQNTLEKIYKADLLEGIEDLYTMDYDKIKDIEGLGEKTAENLKDWLERRSEPWDYEVLAGMNISHWGKTHSKELLKHFTLEEILDLFDKNKLEDKIIEIHGFSDIMADKLIHGLETNRDLLISLKDYHLDIKSFKESLDVANETYKFCITGGLNNWSNRKALKEELEQKGHSVVSGMSSNVDYLITNNKNSSSSKAKKARNLGKPIIDEDELIELLNL